jgi:hypothetical protein
MYGSMNYIRQKYGNPAVLIMENGTEYSSLYLLLLVL